MTSPCLPLAACKSIINQLLDQVPYQGREVKELRCEVICADNLENLACVLDEVMDVAKRFWRFEMVDAWEQAEDLRQVI